MIRFVVRRPLFFILAILVLLLQVAAICADVFFSSPSSSVAPQRDPAKATLTKRPQFVQSPIATGDVDPLAAAEAMPFFPMRASTDNKKLAGHMFQDPKGCGGCHTDIYKEWESS